VGQEKEVLGPAGNLVHAKQPGKVPRPHSLQGNKEQGKGRTPHHRTNKATEENKRPNKTLGPQTWRGEAGTKQRRHWASREPSLRKTATQMVRSTHSPSGEQTHRRGKKQDKGRPPHHRTNKATEGNKRPNKTLGTQTWSGEAGTKQRRHWASRESSLRKTATQMVRSTHSPAWGKDHRRRKKQGKDRPLSHSASNATEGNNRANKTPGVPTWESAGKKKPPGEAPPQRRRGEEKAGSYLFENWKRRRAFRRPYFFRSTTRGSLVRKPQVFKRECRLGSKQDRALEIPCLTAPA
jgi:hypothetical protein